MRRGMRLGFKVSALGEIGDGVYGYNSANGSGVTGRYSPPAGGFVGVTASS